MRIIFAGTPEFAAKTLTALLETEHTVCAVYTQPDRPAGRGRKLTASPVKQIALDHKLAVEQPINFKEQTDCDKLASYQADLMIVVAYGLLLPQKVLDTPALGCINIHASLLPRWRGAAPIQRAILAGDVETGICIMKMEAGLDTGPVITRAFCPIHDAETTQQLHDRLAGLGANTLINLLPNLVERQNKAEPQNDADSTYAAKLQKAEADINWQQSASSIARQINAFNPWPIAQTQWQEKTLRIWSAIDISTIQNDTPGEIIDINKSGIDIACGQGTLRITEVQAPGKKAMAVNDFLNANSLSIGQHFG
jgi:methionyl-tRNA formyltransferase